MSSTISRRVSLAAMVPQILVAHPSVPVNNVQELIAYAKANPGKLNFASVGIGSPGHIAGELFKLRTGVNMVHVPYKGGGPAVTDTLGGQVQLLFVSLPAAWQYVKAGKLKALGVTSDKRSIAAPEVATIVEQGVPDCVVNSWYGVFVPRRRWPWWQVEWPWYRCCRRRNY
jgi:tripartite-type tricarboxylate transporter receptor subunit TctC